jgi:hypothetical protein
VISPTQHDLGRKVVYREYRKTSAGTCGFWVEGRIDAIGKMMVSVEFGDGMRDLNRADLSWDIP